MSLDQASNHSLILSPAFCVQSVVHITSDLHVVGLNLIVACIWWLYHHFIKGLSLIILSTHSEWLGELNLEAKQNI